MNSNALLLAMQALSLHMRQTHCNPDRRPFPFLKLPKELRLIIYEFLAHLHRQDEVSVPVGLNRTTATLVTPLPVPPIHLVCRLIYSEASPFLRKRLRQPTRTIPRIIIPAAHTMRLAKYDGLIDEILNWLHHVRFNKRLLPSKDMRKDLDARFPSIGPSPSFAVTSIARLANVGGLHINALSEKLVGFEWEHWWTESRILKKLAKERVLALGYGEVEMELHILVKGEGKLDMQALLKRLNLRGRDCGVHIVVYRTRKEDWGNEYDLPYQQWAMDGGIVSGKKWLEDWA